ncbi:cupredoxin domain-containing protein [Candidatus Poribacteria bacterium]|nr:cupredoxin domain-containing protein [Candidatus Poribacteria bacterium]
MAETTPSVSEWKSRPVYTRVAIVGLLLDALVSLVFVTLTLIDGDPTTLGFFIIAIALSVIFAGLLWRFGRWALVIAAIWGFVNLSWLVLIPNPSSFFDFVLPLLFASGGLLTVVGAVVAFVQQRRGTARRVSTRRERRTFAAIAVVLLALVLLSGALHIVGLTSVSTEDKAGAIEVELRNSYLAPDVLEIAVGETTRIVVKNNDFFVHTFEIEELGVEHRVLPFSELLIELRPLTL